MVRYEIRLLRVGVDHFDVVFRAEIKGFSYFSLYSPARGETGRLAYWRSFLSEAGPHATQLVVQVTKLFLKGVGFRLLSVKSAFEVFYHLFICPFFGGEISFVPNASG